MFNFISPYLLTLEKAIYNCLYLLMESDMLLMYVIIVQCILTTSKFHIGIYRSKMMMKYIVSLVLPKDMKLTQSFNLRRHLEIL